METTTPTPEPALLSRITNSITFKALSIAFLTLLLLIPVAMVQDLIRDRELSSHEVSREISSKWSYAQTLTGPMIMVPYTYAYVDNKSSKEATGYAYFLPDDLNMTAAMEPEILHRSIYKVVVYQSKVSVNGTFSQPDFSRLNVTPTSVDWKNACLYLGITDMRGIRNRVAFNWNQTPLETMPGIDGSDILNSGMTIKLPLDPDAAKESLYTFDYELSLNGSTSLSFVPAGKTTKIAVSSSWSAPSFDGAFLPDNRNITPQGFTADWNVFNYNRNFPQMWTGSTPDFDEASIHVHLILPVDHYQKSMRAVKYAIIFIALTFLTFFLVELISRKRIHTIQYLLVSVGLVLFYTLLVALSEQMSFRLAYLIAGIAIVGLITAYSHSIFKSSKQTLMMGGFFTILYTFLYVLLQLEDLALLIGSVGLFIALAVIMYASRKINWFQEEGSITKSKTVK